MLPQTGSMLHLRLQKKLGFEVAFAVDNKYTAIYGTT